MEVLGYGGLFLSMGVTLAQLIKNKRALQRKFIRLENLPVLTPQSIIEEIEKDLTGNLMMQGISFLRKNMVFIEGILMSATPFKSLLDPTINLIYSVSYRKDLYSKREFSNNYPALSLLPEKEQQTIRIAPGFILKDYETNQVCDIQNKPNTNMKGNLICMFICTPQNKTDFEKLHFIQKGFLQTMFSSLVELTRLILNVAYLKSKYLKKKGAYEGYMDIEMGLKQNCLVTIFGDIIYDVRNKKLVMENPLFILKDKEQLLQLINKQLIFKRFVILVLSIPLIIGGIMFIKKLFEFINNYIKIKKDKLITHLRKKMDDLATNKNLHDNYKCNICYYCIRNIILKPCLHMCLCHNCLKRLQRQECPICKTEIASSVEIFVQ